MPWFNRNNNKRITVEQVVSTLETLSKKNGTLAQTLKYMSSDTSPAADVFREYLGLANDCGGILDHCVKELELLLVDESGKKQQALLSKIDEQCKVLEGHVGNRTEYDLMKSVQTVKEIQNLVRELGRL